jgi:hypothetical protein
VVDDPAMPGIDTEEDLAWACAYASNFTAKGG